MWTWALDRRLTARQKVVLEGKPGAGVDDLHRVLTDVRVGVSCSLTVLRHTEKLQLRVVPQEAKVE